jgi:pimeloyl-ACP methyl ester carboxylesterase
MWKMFIGIGLLLGIWIGAGLIVVAAAGPFTPAGRYVDIGDRRLRLVCAGPASDKPTVWMEAGAFGLAADFAAIQEKLAAKGLRSCAYDRAGMGWSDPGPEPRDSAAIVGDLEKLIAESGERGPFILMAHSMAGLHVRLFAARNPKLVAGLVLIEATTPEQVDSPGVQKFLHAFAGASRAVAVVNTLGLSRAFYYTGDKIGLPPQGKAEKRHAYVSGRHARTAANEVANWRRSAAKAGAAATYDPRWPVAVIVAGGGLGADFNNARRVPERASRAGYFEQVPQASHNSVLGETWDDAVVRGVEHVLANLPAAD